MLWDSVEQHQLIAHNNMKGNSMPKRLLAALAAAALAVTTFLAGPAFAVTSLKANGSSFAYKFISSCATKQNDYAVNYLSTGSGIGRSSFGASTVDFAASDAASSISTGRTFRYIPVVGGPIAVMYNVPGIANTKLKLDAATVAKIFSGKITKWNDAAIKKLQVAAIKSKLPNKPIRVVYRSTNSGTSENFTDFLRQNVPSIWTKAKNGTIASGNPAGRMPAGAIGAANAQALVTSVKNTQYTIGYSDLSDSVDSNGNAKVTVAKLKNANGEYIAPSSASSSKFLQEFYGRATFNSATGAVTLDFTKVIAGAYNMSLVTYAIADRGASSAKAEAVEGFVKYLLNTCGPDNAQDLGYAPITGQLKVKSLELADAIHTTN
jgi:phosphate transport system substrate-binding protein